MSEIRNLILNEIRSRRSSPRRSNKPQLQDRLPIKDSKVSKESLEFYSNYFFKNAGDTRAKNGSWWLFQIEAMLNAWIKFPRLDGEAIVEKANEIIIDSGYTAQKFLITRKNLINNVRYVKQDLLDPLKGGLDSRFSNINQVSSMIDNRVDTLERAREEALREIKEKIIRSDRSLDILSLAVFNREFNSRYYFKSEEEKISVDENTIERTIKKIFEKETTKYLLRKDKYTENDVEIYFK